MSGDVALRTVAFGDAEGRVWGATIAGPPVAGPTASSVPPDAARLPAVIAFGLGDGHGQTAAATVEPEERGWRMSGDGIALHVEPAGEEGVSNGGDGAAGPSGFQELCRVSGELTLSGAPHRVDCVGTRCALEGVDPGSVQSLRAVAGWFGDDDAFMLLALRAGSQRGSEADLIAATLFDPEGWVPVTDPRLSTTYDGSGVPRRANLELWIGEGESEFPRRAAGEAAGAATTVEADGLTVRVVPLRCHSRGREGAGVYILAEL